MNLEDKCSVKHFHQLCLRESGEGTTGALGWVEKEHQQIRFKVLSEIGDLNNASILDLGCGYGHFKPFLETKFSNISYTGIDFMPEFIKVASKRFINSPQTSFICNDISEDDLPSADYVFASGVFCYKTSEEKYYTNLITKMYNACRKGIGFNMLNIDKFPTSGFLKTHGANGVETFCRKLSNNVMVRKDYVPDDFTVYIYR